MEDSLAQFLTSIIPMKYSFSILKWNTSFLKIIGLETNMLEIKNKDALIDKKYLFLETLIKRL